MKAKEGQSSTEPHTVTTANLGTENIYQIAWRSEANYRMIAEHHPETNTYVPSSIPLFSLLESAEKRINVSKHIQQHEPTYNPYAVKMYYAYMYYIQILRARRDSGLIEGFENSLLKRFEIKNPPASLPCAEIVFGYFTSIVATELAEAKYDWIVPRIAIPNLSTTPRTTTRLNAPDITTGAFFLQPSIPHMMAILNSFIHQTPASLPDRMEESDTYIPVDTHPNNHGDINMFNTTMHDNDNTSRSLKVLLASPGVNSSMVFGNENYSTAARHARRTDFGRDINIVVSVTDMDGRAGLTADYSYTDLDSFLMMEKTSNLRFFSYLREQAVIHARFFDKVYHFSDVQTTGGLETTVICQLKLINRTARHFADTNLDVRQSFDWYHNPFRTLQAGFATNRAGLRRNEELQSFAYGTNSSLPIPGLNLRTGPFWSNQEWIQSLFFDVDATNAPVVVAMTNTGKPMFTDHNSMVLRCYREKPHGTGIVDNEFD
jgi:hypothetical protein